MRVPRNFIESLLSNRGLPMIHIHTPKCGGSFVNSAFGERFKQCPTLRWSEAKGHKTFLEYRDIFEKRGDSLTKYVLFTVIRNPWDWHLSWFNYVSKDAGGRNSGMLLEHEQIKDLSFSGYIKWLEDMDQPRSLHDYARRQVSDWIIDDNGKIAVHEVLRQERLEEDLRSLKEKYGLRITVPYGQRINSSRSERGYRWSYSDEDAEIIARRHQRDIALFGYRFE